MIFLIRVVVEKYTDGATVITVDYSQGSVNLVLE